MPRRPADGGGRCPSTVAANAGTTGDGKHGYPLYVRASLAPATAISYLLNPIIHATDSRGSRVETATTIEQLNDALAGRYLIEREIGRGGMATVYLARDLRHERKVALKLLLAELGAILGPERFLSEIRVTANLQHPNLLPLFDSGEASGRLFYVMPYVDGESLRHRLSREKQIAIDEAIRITVACASALDYAHRSSVIHRDLKPENILLSAGQPVIADFGIALAVSNAGGARITQSGLSLGTPQYMSPEQAAGDREVDGRSDIYSLACVLYEMLTGDPPHTGSTVQAVIAKVLVEKPRSVRSQRDRVPEHVEAAIDRALAKIPADRWATAGEFCEALSDPAMTAARARPGEDGVASRYVPASRGMRIFQRALWPAIAIAAATMAVVAWRRLATDPPARAISFVVATPATAPLALDPSLVLFTPDGSAILYAASVSGRRRLHVRRLSDLTAREIRGTDDAILPFLSPDGKWIGFGTDSGVVYRVPASGGTPVPIARATATRGGRSVQIPRTTAYRGGTWSSRGDIVIGSDSGLYTIARSGGQPRLFTRPDRGKGERAHLQPMFLPDGKNVVFRIEDQVARANDRLGVASLDGDGHELLDLAGSNPLAFIDGKLYFGKPGGMIASVPFDPRRGRAVGQPVIVVEDVSVFSGAAASFAPDGSLVYVKSSNASRLTITDDRAASIKVAAAEERRYFVPRLSPDGRRIAVQISGAGGATSQSDIWVFDTLSRVLSRVTSQATSEQPEWTPDGRYIVYGRLHDGKWEVWRVPSDGSGPEERFFVWERSVREMSFSPDGKLAVFGVTDPATNRDVWLVSLDSLGRRGSATPLLVSGFNELAPRISPDGRWLTYISDESGQYEVYVRPFRGAGPRVQVSTNGGTQPLWTSNGGRIVYRSGDKFIAARLATASGISVTSREELFEGRYVSRLGHPQYDVDRTATKFVLLQPVGTPEIIVVLNGLENLSSNADRD
jgi:eukaryotic-like serine/threonine-protein kinase